MKKMAKDKNYQKRMKLKKELDSIVKEYKTKHPNKKMTIEEVE